MADTASRTARDLVAALVRQDKAAYDATWASVASDVGDGPDPAELLALCGALVAQVYGVVAAVAEHFGVQPADYLAAVDASRAPRTNGSHP